MTNVLAGNVGCQHVGQRVKMTDIFYVGDMSADMLADMLVTCSKKHVGRRPLMLADMSLANMSADMSAI